MGYALRPMNEPEAIRELLSHALIHVVGLSPDPSRPSHGVARYLRAQGYRIVPINPEVEEVLGERSHARLESAPGPVRVVNVFRRPQFVRGHVEEAIGVGARGVWLQLGVIDEQAARLAQEAGLLVVMDRCIAIEHRRLRRQGMAPPVHEG